MAANKGPSPLLLFLVIGLGAFTVTSVLSARMVEKVYDKKAVDVRFSNNPKLIAVRELDHEMLFRSTIKNCLPSLNPKCKRFTPEVSGKRQERVALISPPGGVSSILLNLTDQILIRHYGRDLGTDIQSFIRHSVPPYGYGKTHGLTKIVRLVPQPLVLEVTDAFQNLLEPGESVSNITLGDLKAGLRQVLRYHCRLSAVAAHTAQLSINYLEVATDMSSVMKQLQHFLLDSPRNKEGSEQQSDKIPTLTVHDQKSGMLDKQISYGTQVLTHVQESNHVDVLTALDQVLLDELVRSRNLTIWPCPSFWSVGDEPNQLSISPLIQRLAKALSPDCEDPLAQCWVDRDMCESRGDALCQKKRR